MHFEQLRKEHVEKDPRYRKHQAPSSPVASFAMFSLQLQKDHPHKQLSQCEKSVSHFFESNQFQMAVMLMIIIDIMAGARRSLRLSDCTTWLMLMLMLIPLCHAMGTQ
eukprot:SAG31_NODE_6212_length_2119_cov_1.734653_1_plen_108_part_00